MKRQHLKKFGVILLGISACLLGAVNAQEKQVAKSEGFLKVKKTQLLPLKPVRGWADRDPQEYKDLIPVYHEVPDALNAVPELLKLSDELDNDNKKREYSKKWRAFKKAGEAGKWDKEYWAKFLKQNEAIYQQIDVILKKPWIQDGRSEAKIL